MTKFWALIVSSRPHIFALGPHETSDKAMDFAEAYCSKKTADNEKVNDENKTKPDYDPVRDLPSYDLIYILDENDLRSLIGEVHRPYVIARQRKEIEVKAPETHGVEPVGDK